MKVEAGKRYVRRDGSVTPKLVVGDYGYIRDAETGYLYLENDPYVIGESHLDNYDLISEYVENPAQTTLEEAINNSLNNPSALEDRLEDRFDELERIYTALNLVLSTRQGSISELLEEAGKVLRFIDNNRLKSE